MMRLIMTGNITRFYSMLPFAVTINCSANVLQEFCICKLFEEYFFYLRIRLKQKIK